MSAEKDYYEYLMHAKLTGDLSDQEENEFNELLKDDPEMNKAFIELKSLFNEEDISSKFKRFKSPERWKDILGESSKLRNRAKILRMRTVAAAAIILGIAVCGWWLWPGSKNIENPLIVAKNERKIVLKLDNGKVVDLSSQQGSITAESTILHNENQTLSYSDNTVGSTGYNKLTVPTGIDYKIVLSDGTKVWLNAASELEFPFNFNGTTREIKINGEAYLEVAKDKSKPFIVHLPNSSVNVLGTEFNVNTYHRSQVKISLVNGSILIKTAVKELSISPGKEAVINESANIIQQDFNLKYTLSWREGKFYFHNASLQDISEVLPRWYGIQVTIDDSALQPRRFTGMVNKNRPIQYFMEDIRGISGINTYLDKNRVLHFK